MDNFKCEKCLIFNATRFRLHLGVIKWNIDTYYIYLTQIKF